MYISEIGEGIHDKTVLKNKVEETPVCLLINEPCFVVNSFILQ